MSEANVHVERVVGRNLTLDDLITAAVQLAGDDAVSHGARLWRSEGGRPCPLGWPGCSQPVYVDLKTGEHDYGEPGGPGHADCVRNCKNGMQHYPDDDEDLPLWQTLDDDSWAESDNSLPANDQNQGRR